MNNNSGATKASDQEKKKDDTKPDNETSGASQPFSSSEWDTTGSAAAPRIRGSSAEPNQLVTRSSIDSDDDIDGYFTKDGTFIIPNRTVSSSSSEGEGGGEAEAEANLN